MHEHKNIEVQVAWKILFVEQKEVFVLVKLIDYHFLLEIVIFVDDVAFLKVVLLKAIAVASFKGELGIEVELNLTRALLFQPLEVFNRTSGVCPLRVLEVLNCFVGFFFYTIFSRSNYVVVRNLHLNDNWLSDEVANKFKWIVVSDEILTKNLIKFGTHGGTKQTDVKVY